MYICGSLCEYVCVCVSLIISALTFCRLEEEKRQLQREYDHLPKKEVKEKERGERKKEIYVHLIMHIPGCIGAR